MLLAESLKPVSSTSNVRNFFLNISLLELKVKIILLYKGRKFCNHSHSNLDFLLHKNNILQVYFQNAHYTQLPQCAIH